MNQAFYAPWRRGVYDVRPGLVPFGTDFGNGESDQRLFQIDEHFDRYLENKERALKLWPNSHCLESNLEPAVRHAAECLMRRHLGVDKGGLEDLMLQVQEDIAIVATEGLRDWLAWACVCSPSHWAPEAKIGRSFFDVHKPIPGFEKVNQASAGLVNAMVSKGPFVRFVWGLESSPELNCHPRSVEPRDFRRGVWVRTERQVTWPLRGVGAALFSIRVYNLALEQLSTVDRNLLKQALLSMSPEARVYKGVAEQFDLVLSQLSGG